MSPDRTMFVALHGELAVHPWRAADVAASDAYSLFVARSSAMGWLAGPGADAACCGLWGMNDAGQETDGARSSRIAWFQVSLCDPVPPARPLPVQAFLACAADVVGRIGNWRLEAVQLLLPVQALNAPAPDAVMTLLQDAGWFADSDSSLRTRVRVTLDSGQDPSIRTAAPGMLAWLRGLKQGAFSFEAISMTDDDGDGLPPAVIDELWRGPAQHRATFPGTLAEWSLGAVGWLAGLVADASARHGVKTPLMLTITRLASGPPVR